MFSLANKVLFTLLMIQISLFCVLLLYLSSYYLTPSHGSDEKFRILVQKFRIKSPLCEHELPSQDHYKQEYGERVGNFLWRYVKRHREITCSWTPHLPRRFLLFRASAGLGNRLQSLASAFLFAVLSDRAFFLEWNPQNGSHMCYWHDLFALPDIDWNVKSIESVLNHPLATGNVLHLKFDDPMELDPFLCANLTTYYENYPIVTIATDEYFAPLLRHGFHKEDIRLVFDDVEPFRPLAKFLFRPRKELRDKIEEFYRVTFGDRGCEVGLQMRHFGIGRVFPNNSNVFFQCTKKILDVTDNESNQMMSKSVLPRVFLTTDTNATRRDAQIALGSTQVVWYSNNVRSQLVQSCDEVKNALIDLYLLAKCKRIIGTSFSSFATVAYSMANVNPVIVGYIPKGGKRPAGLPWHHLPRNACYQQNFSHPCYFEYTHIKHLSCFTPEMFATEACCSVGLCQGCLHHSYQLEPFFYFFHWNLFKILKTLAATSLASFILFHFLIYNGMNRRRAKRTVTRGVVIFLIVLLLFALTVRFQYYRSKRRKP